MPKIESQPLTVQDSFDVQPQEINQGNPNPTVITKEKDKEEVEMGKLEIKGNKCPVNVLIVDRRRESKANLCKFLDALLSL